MTKPIIGYIHYYCADDVEVEGLFDFNFKLISWWCLNDASWRDEYFSHGLDLLGVRIRRIPENKEAIANKQLKKAIN